jgi:hypothetical protein
MSLAHRLSGLAMSSGRPAGPMAAAVLPLPAGMAEIA